MLILLVLVLVLVLPLLRLLPLLLRRPDRRGRRQKKPAGTAALEPRLTRPKPPWVREEVLRLKALMPANGCRKIAVSFNHLHQDQDMSISKSFVATVLRHEGHRILAIRRRLKNRTPLPWNLIWGMDLTFLSRQEPPVLGLIDHGTRACLSLQAIRSKASIEILKILLDACERFGTPRTIRTDNEAVFTSRLFCFGLWLLGVRHQRTAPFFALAKWQNRKIFSVPQNCLAPAGNPTEGDPARAGSLPVLVQPRAPASAPGRAHPG